MKTNSTQQEILLVIGTDFTARQWCSNRDENAASNLTAIEQLTEACWNGILQEELPELCREHAGSEKLFIWQVRQTSSFLELEMGDVPCDPDPVFSLDPYLFMLTVSEN